MTDIAKPEDVFQVAPGDVVAGKYRVERVLGQGAMGIVVAARHEDLGQKVAIKLLHPDVNASDDGRERFLREARAAAKLESDHVARVFDVGTFGNKNAYMVMEHLEGSDLEKHLEIQGALPIDEAVDYVLETLEALAHAHVHGMVHRDIKPSNLFLVQRMDGTRRVKILDFGISKTESGLGVSSPGSSTLTSPQAVLGSPAYMAPEQIRSSKHVDQRADIWSVGIVLYELITGKSPFLGETVGDTLARVLASRPEPVNELRPDAPKELVAVITRCLEVDEKNRFQNVGEVAQALAPFASPKTRELPARISRILAANTLAPVRAIIPSDPGVRVNVAAETLAVPEFSPAKGTQITSTSGNTNRDSGKSSRSFFVLAAIALIAAFAIFSVMNRNGNNVPAPDRVSVATQSPPQTPSSTMPTAMTPPGPEIVPMVLPEPSASANAPFVSASATNSAPISSNTKSTAKAAASTTKKNTPTNPKYPSGLLDGRD